MFYLVGSILLSLFVWNLIIVGGLGGVAVLVDKWLKRPIKPQAEKAPVERSVKPAKVKKPKKPLKPWEIKMHYYADLSYSYFTLFLFMVIPCIMSVSWFFNTIRFGNYLLTPVAAALFVALVFLIRWLARGIKEANPKPQGI